MKNFSLFVLLIVLCIGFSGIKAQTTFWDKTQRVTSGFVDKNPTFDSRKTINYELLYVSFLLFERHTSPNNSNICYLKFGYDSAFSAVGFITNDSNKINRNPKFAFKQVFVFDSIWNAMAVWERVENARVNIYGSTYSNGIWSLPYPIDTGGGNKSSPNISYNTQQSTMNLYCVVYEKDGDIIFKNYESTTHQVYNETNLTLTDTSVCKNPKVTSHIINTTQPIFVTYERQKANGDFAIYYKNAGTSYVFTGDTISTRGNNRNADFINGYNYLSVAFESNYSGKWGIYEYINYSGTNIYTILQNSGSNYRNLKNYLYPMITNSPQFSSMLTSYLAQKGNTTKIYSTVMLVPPMDSIIVGDSTSGCVLTMSTGVYRYGSATARIWVVYTKDSAGYSMLNAAGKLIPLGDVKMIGGEVPERYELMQNYPNPFNPRTAIRFDIQKPEVRSQNSVIKLIIYDVMGREVRTLVNEKLNPGRYEINFEGTGMNSGVYFYQMSVGDFRETRRMLLIK